MSYGPEGEAFFCDVCEDNPKRCNKIDCPGRDHPDDPHTQAKERMTTPPSHDAEIAALDLIGLQNIALFLEHTDRAPKHWHR